MLPRLIKKFSSLLYRIHVWLEKQFQGKTSFTPYPVRSATSLSSPKIFHFNGNFVIGGSSQLIVDLVERTSPKYRHTIIVPEIPTPLPYQPLDIHPFSLDEMNKLYDFLKKEKPSLVHIHYWVRHYDRHRDFSLWYQAVFKICEELKLPVIQNINVPTKPYESGSVIHNVFVSQYVEENFNDQHEVEHSVIYPGSDMEHFSNEHLAEAPSKNIGMVYRLAPDKLDPQAIEVFINLAKKQNDILCYIIGDGQYMRHYRNRVKQEGLSKRFVFTGYVSYRDLPSYYNKLNIILAPVHDESFGQVTPFAMGMGLVVAGYDTGALSEILGSKETLVKTGDIEKLTSIVIDLINDPERLIALSKRNQQRAREIFTTEQMIRQYERLYSSYIQSTVPIDLK
jgi:glycosyltransferase involved in cell wall biosynthesis